MKRRHLLQTATMALLLGRQHLAWGASIVAVRVWPAPDYSRVTIESDSALKVRQFFVPNPPRLAVDIEGIELNPALRELVAKVRSDDPTIAGIRVAQNAPGVVRLVLDLKQAVAPQVFTLPPVAAYQHRLVFDLYPTQVADPLEALIAERIKDTPPVDPLGDLIAQRTPTAIPGQPDLPKTVATTPINAPARGLNDSKIAAVPAPRTAATAATDRLIIIALDPGHGGEDPGAIGPGGTREKDVVLRLAHRLRDRIDTTTINGNT